MKKLITLSIFFSFVFSNLLAEAQEVPKLSPEQTTFKKRNWQPWAIATITVLIAGTGIYLTSRHQGHSSSDNK
ncbi:MAG: hypothetical protein WCT85_00030 [Parachlamydiales bacterium]